VASTYEYIHQCKQARNETIILKLDFAKAFDTINHFFMLKILSCQGCDDRWLSMVVHTFVLGTSTILPNGVPAKKHPCLRGVT
jgi:hypothetical protein